MKIVIPMSGTGQRFMDAGYTTLKPLIEISEMPMIEHIVNLFDKNDDFIFIVSNTALENKKWNITNILKKIVPNSTIVSISPQKKGPIYAVSQIYDLIDDNEEVIVNYCDFSMHWDYKDFLKHTRDRNADGAVVSYRDFHPHMLGTTNYAFMRDNDQWMLEIQEKQPFTNDRMSEFASAGTYYFKTGSILKKYFNEVLDNDINLNGEYYVSLPYNLLVRDGLTVSIYKIQHMLQWGTPEEFEEYMFWSNLFELKTSVNTFDSPIENTNNLMLMAGLGSRFKDEGYMLPKPLIPVSAKPMVIQAVDSYPKASSYSFVMLKEYDEEYNISPILNEYPKLEIFLLDKLTEGQACSAFEGLKGSEDRPTLIAACDCELIIDKENYKRAALENDIVVFSFKNNPNVKRNPKAYGYLKVNNDQKVVGVSVKVPISNNPEHDHAIVGSFFFKSSEIFKKVYEKLVADNIKVNNEFYIDSMLEVAYNMGYSIAPLEVTYVGYGTPNDYETFCYWQSFFDKAYFHPYSLEKDPAVPKHMIAEIRASYTNFEQEAR